MMNRLFALALASCALLPAQDKASPFRCVPAEAKLVMRIGAPAKWSQTFAKTQAAKLLEAPALAPMRTGIKQAIDAGLEELRSGGAFDAELVEKLLSNYAGELVVGVVADVPAILESLTSGEVPHFGVVLGLTPDGSYDLAKLCAAIGKLAEENGEFADLQVGDHRLRCTKEEDDVNIALPTMIDGQMVVLISDDLAKFAEKALGTGERFAGGSGNPALFAQLGVASIVKPIAKALGEMGAAQVDLDAMFGALGLHSLDSFAMSVGAEGSHAAADVTIAFNGQDRGMFGAFTTGKGAPKLLRYVPADADTFSVAPVDFGTLFTSARKVWQTLEGQAPMTWDEAMDKVKEELKVRLKEDLIDHLGGELLTLQDAEASTAASAGDEDPMAALDGMCFGIALRDGKAFGESLETAMRARGLHAARKTEEYQGTKVHRLKLAGVFEIEYAVTDDLWAIGLGGGEHSTKAMRSLLDAHAKPAAAGEAPAHVKSRLQALGNDWHSVSALSVAGWMKGFARGFESAMAMQGADLPPQVGEMVATLGKLGGDLNRLGLQTAVSTAQGSGSRWITRFLW